ncbi:MAG: DUF2917 domain-containing protein [Rubrivivax sp.]|nr:DUF2917 domain-containing protein [Rubrivivax sp.]
MNAHVSGTRPGHATVPPPGGTGCVALDHGRFLHLRGSAGTTVAAVDGLLWVTRDGSWDDVLLQPGERFRVPDQVPVLVSAFGSSVARVAVPARPAAPWRRLAGWLRGAAATVAAVTTSPPR